MATTTGAAGNELIIFQEKLEIDDGGSGAFGSKRIDARAGEHVSVEGDEAEKDDHAEQCPRHDAIRLVAHQGDEQDEFEKDKYDVKDDYNRKNRRGEVNELTDIQCGSRLYVYEP